MCKYKSIKQIKNLRAEKLEILEKVYKEKDLNKVYENQNALGSMSISIRSDVASAILPTLQEDGVSNIIWPKISLRLEKLSFISVPTTSEIQEKYKQSIENPTVVKIEGSQPKPGTKTNVKKISTPSFLAILAAQGIAVPLLLSFAGGSKWALVKIIPCVINAAAMVIEVVSYFDLTSKKDKTTSMKRKSSSLNKRKSTAENNVEEFKNMCIGAIKEVEEDNRNKLNGWFDILEQITEEEIKKMLDKAEE